MLDWPTIRDHYLRLMAEAGRTQKDIARDGGLHQSAVSKMLANTKRGPTVSTFGRAVQGLGLSLTDFFATLEQVERAPERAIAEHERHLRSLLVEALRRVANTIEAARGSAVTAGAGHKSYQRKLPKPAKLLIEKEVKL